MPGRCRRVAQNSQESNRHARALSAPMALVSHGAASVTEQDSPGLEEGDERFARTLK
jgi:hypothetical protein